MPSPVLPLKSACLMLLVLATWQGGFPAAGAIPNYVFHAWQSDDGLPQNAVTAVLQSQDGYLWVGTYSGLARFDGVRFTVFNDNNTPELASSRVTSLFEAPDGTLWIGHENGAVTRCRNGQFERVEVLARWTSGKILSIATDGSGEAWLLNQDGLLARVRDGLVLEPESGGAPNLVMLARAEDGAIWVARGGRVSKLEHGRLTTIQFGSEPPSTFIQGIGAGRDGGLWVVLSGRVRKWKDGRWTQDGGVSPWGIAPVLTLMESRQGCLVAGTSQQGFCLLFPGREFAALEFNRARGFPSDWITAACEDREGDLWIGTGGGGVAVVRPAKVQTLSPPDQWHGRPVLSVCAGHDGTMWMGTEGVGLYCLRNEAWTHFSIPTGITTPYVWSLAEDSEGRLWAGTWGGGLLLHQGEGFAPAPGLDDVKSPLTSLLPARGGGLWVGSGAGVFHYQDGAASWLTENQGQTLRDVRAIAEETSGTLWLGLYGGGLARLKDGNLRQFRRADGLANDYVSCLRLEPDGTLWIGTSGGGLNRLKADRMALIDQRHGLPNNFICHIEEDDLGCFWISSHNGIFRVAKADLDRCADRELDSVHCLTYGLSDGMPTLLCSGGLQPSGCRTADGRLWFSTSKGLAIVDPHNVHTNQLPPPVVIEEFRVDDVVLNLTMDTDRGGARHPGPLDSPRARSKTDLKIPPGRHRFEFQYTALSFVAPEKVQFKHRLERLDTDWVPAGGKRSANYNYLPPGKYTFHVTAGNNDGVWNEAGVELGFTVLPYVWQTLWFRLLTTGLMAAGVGGLAWFETRSRMRRKLERSEGERVLERERGRIANDIHDDLGASLTRISMLSQTARSESDNAQQVGTYLDQIYVTTRELTRELSEIVWAINPHHDRFDSLAAYLEKFAQDYLRAGGMRCRLDLPEQIPQWPLSAEVRHNLFLAFKEAINNTLRHSGATEVQVSLRVKPEAFVWQVEDNGRGFDPETVRPGSGNGGSGNGLPNMRRRLQEIGGRCEIQSVPGQGTKIIFIVPLKTS
jgi:signal transduction histidine kinase/ligand-binding sensor domain-containing protein